jgi:AcrR family transcriptional regulator
MTDLAPRKHPRQKRARATVEAILDACAQILSNGAYEALTTNHVSERAGVSIGTLYEYFPNRESIVAALAIRAFGQMAAEMNAAVMHSEGLSDHDMAEHLIETGVSILAARKHVLKVLMQDAPFVLELDEVRQARKALDNLTRTLGVLAGDRIWLPEPGVDVWLISQMLYSAMFQVAFHDCSPGERRKLVKELARLTYRMATGGDLNSSPQTNAPFRLPPASGFDFRAAWP